TASCTDKSPRPHLIFRERNRIWFRLRPLNGALECYRLLILAEPHLCQGVPRSREHFCCRQEVRALRRRFWRVTFENENFARRTCTMQCEFQSRYAAIVEATDQFLGRRAAAHTRPAPQIFDKRAHRQSLPIRDRKDRRHLLAPGIQSLVRLLTARDQQEYG